jgi:hypothetical protein
MCRLLLCILFTCLVDANFLYILCMFVLMRVDEQATENLGLQLVETAEQELVEGKLCP